MAFGGLAGVYYFVCCWLHSCLSHMCIRFSINFFFFLNFFFSLDFFRFFLLCLLINQVFQVKKTNSDPVRSIFLFSHSMKLVKWFLLEANLEFFFSCINFHSVCFCWKFHLLLSANMKMQKKPCDHGRIRN